MIQLERLIEGLPAISPAFGAFLVEACQVCLAEGEHESGAELGVMGDINDMLTLHWAGELNDQIRNSWRDKGEATEYGATAMAILLVLALTDLTVTGRSVKGTGFDYWLGPKENTAESELFEGSVRLEISGILSGDLKLIERRVKAKLKQTQRSDHLGLPALVIVTEFRKLLSYFAEK
ncbi:MAG: hypothetical protein AAF927_28015 [Bacteroidota bacterium]